MTNSKDTSNPIKDWLDTLLQSGPEALDAISIITSKRLSPNAKKELLQNIDAFLEEIHLLVSRFAERHLPIINKHDVLIFGKYLDKNIRTFMPEIPSDINVIDYLVPRIDPPSSPSIEPLDPISLFYIESKHELRRLVNDVYSLSTYDVVDAYLDDVDNYHEDIFPVAQFLFMKGKEQSELLRKPRSRFTRNIVEKSMMIYSDIAGLFEKNVVIIRGLVEIVNMEKPDYNKLRSITLGRNIRYISDSGYSRIVDRCDLLMRNAIAHNSYYFVPSKYKVDFYDPGQDDNVAISYRDIVIKTQQLYGLLLSTAEWRAIITAEYLRSIKNQLFITAD